MAPTTNTWRSALVRWAGVSSLPLPLSGRHPLEPRAWRAPGKAAGLGSPFALSGRRDESPWRHQVQTAVTSGTDCTPRMVPKCTHHLGKHAHQILGSQSTERRPWEPGRTDEGLSLKTGRTDSTPEGREVPGALWPGRAATHTVPRAQDRSVPTRGMRCIQCQ